MTVQDVWLPGGANPVMAHGRGVSVPAPVAREYDGVEAEANRECGVVPQPLCELPVPPQVLPERAAQLERDFIAQDVIAGARQLMRHRLQGHQ